MAEFETYETVVEEYIIVRFVKTWLNLNWQEVRYADSEPAGTREKNGKTYQLYKWFVSDDINEVHRFDTVKNAKWRPKIVGVFKALVAHGYEAQVVRVKETTSITTEMVTVDPVKDAVDGLAEIARKVGGA